jgi:hypothetical protein
MAQLSKHLMVCFLNIVYDKGHQTTVFVVKLGPSSSLLSGDGMGVILQWHISSGTIAQAFNSIL